MRVLIKKTHPNAVIPKYFHKEDACFDLTAIDEIVVDKGEYGYIEYNFGLAFEIPIGYVGLIFPRSSISKTGAILSNSVGVIDSNFRGTVTARFKQVNNTVKYQVGDRVAQMMIIPIPKIELVEVEELSESERGSMGYGSTGK